jgi:hypothetical protein
MKPNMQLLFGNPLDKLDPLIEAGNFFVDVINAILSGDTGFLIETFLSLILLIPNLLMWIVFRLLAGVAGFVYEFMLATTTRTPVPRTSSGGLAVIRSPASDDVFSGLQAVIEGSIIPISLVFVVFGIALVLFVRVFDVVIKFNFNSEEAQRRLLVSPILISLWVPLANLVLALSLGLTSLFLDGISIDPSNYGDLDDIQTVNSDGNLDPVTLLEEGAVGNLEDNPKNFLTGTDPIAILMRLLFGVYVAIFIVPVGIIAAFLAVLRLVLLYIFYTLGPIGIMMWAITWRDIGSLGEKIVRYFVLLALFPIPAALMSVLLPIISIGVEDAVVAGFSDILGGSANAATGDLNFLDAESMVQIMMAGASIVIIGFAPWALVLGVGKATAVAGTATAASGVAAGVGTGAVASGAGKAGKKAVSNKATKSVASGASSKAKGLGNEAYSSLSEGNQQKIQSAANVASSAKEKVGQNATLRSGGEKISSMSENVSREDIMEKASGGLAGGLRTAGFNNTADTLEKSVEGVNKEKQMERAAAKKRRQKGELIRSEKAEKGLIDDMPDDVGKAEMDLLERAAADGMDKQQVQELAARSDRIQFDENTVEELYEEDEYGNEELTSDGKKIIGETMLEEVSNSDNKEELVREFGRPMAERMMEQTSFDVDDDYRDLTQHAEESSHTTREELMSGQLESFERFRGHQVEGANAFTNENRWVLDEKEFDEEKAIAATEKLEKEGDSYAQKGLAGVAGVESDNNSVTNKQYQELAEAYKNGNIEEKAEDIVNPNRLETDDENFNQAQFYSNLAESVQNQIDANIQNSKQIPRLHGNQGELSDEDISLLPENAIEEAVQETDSGFDVDPNELPMNEEHLQQMITSARPDDRKQVFERTLDMLEEEMNPKLERSKQFQGATEDEKNAIKDRIKQTVEDDVQVVTDQESEMLAEHLNQMQEGITEEFVDQIESTEIKNDAIKGELDSDTLASNLKPDEVDFVGDMELHSQIKDYVETEYDQIANNIDETIGEALKDADIQRSDLAMDNIQGEGDMSPREFMQDIGLTEDKIKAETTD